MKLRGRREDAGGAPVGPQGDGAAGGEVAVVRRAVTNASAAVVGYELLVDSREPSLDPWRSATGTSDLLSCAFGDIGLADLVGAVPAWVPVSRAFLIEMGLPPVRPDRVVLQVPAFDGPVPTVLLDAVQNLAAMGYTLALAGYDGGDEAASLLPVCGLTTIDVGENGDEATARAAARARAQGATLVATGVRDATVVAPLERLGFTLFSGPFFSRPDTVRGRSIGSGQVASLAALAELCAPDVGFERVEEIISRDVGLALKLLRYVNSAFFALPRTVGSVREALTLLGPRMVRRWALVMALAGSTTKSAGLLAVALQRARLCEMIAAGDATADEQRESLFTVGLFSVADALMDRPMSEVLDTLPFSDELRTALLDHDGPKGELLSTVLAFERGDFEAAARHGLDPAVLPQLYREATVYADQVVRQLPR